MADKKISGATPATPAVTDYVPIAKSGDETAYYVTLGQIIGMATGMNLTANAAASATTISVSSTPAGAASGLGWVAIDPYTTECEIRKVTTLSGTTLTVSALSYSHTSGDPVLWLPSPVANVKWFGAKGDDSTDDQLAINRATAQMESLGGGMVYAPFGTYRISATIDIGAHVGLVGDGYDTVFKATGAITMMTVENVASVGNRYGRLANFFLEGADLAVKGLYCELSVLRHYENIQIENITGANGKGLVLSNCQNNVFQSIKIDDVVTGIYIEENASNNTFTRCNVTDATTYCIRMYTSVLAAPSGNSFDCCLFEQSTSATHSLLVDDGARNLFQACTFGANENNDIIALLSGATDNVFICCLVSGDRGNHLPVVDNDGNRNHFIACKFQDTGGAAFTAGDDIIDTSAQLYLNNNYYRDGEAVESGSGQIVTSQAFGLGNPTKLTISAGAITVNNEKSTYKIEDEAEAGADNLDTINGGWDGMEILLQAFDSTHDIVVRDNAASGGNIYLNGAVAFTMDHARDRIRLMRHSSTAWVELFRSNNG